MCVRLAFCEIWEKFKMMMMIRTIRLQLQPRYRNFLAILRWISNYVKYVAIEARLDEAVQGKILPPRPTYTR